TNKESIAVDEARRLGIPVMAIVDSNSDPSGIKFPVPGNDDALRAVQTYCDLFAGAVLDGLQAEMKAAGVDVGSAARPTGDDLPAEGGEAAAAEGAEPPVEDKDAKPEGEAKAAKKAPRKGARRAKEKAAAD